MAYCCGQGHSIVGTTVIAIQPDQATSSVTAKRSCPCKQPACPAVGGGLEVTFKPLVPRSSVREGNHERLFNRNHTQSETATGLPQVLSLGQPRNFSALWVFYFSKLTPKPSTKEFRMWKYDED
ncbi:hypothetical protein J6590_016072 [Homalodisca vitripennis]|nr:hypothetical protein J6590_016072 [Homalodisca vitripennis]